ncbi:hypothetical protein GCM10027299_52550 [Larkinella ripae]
MNVDNPTPAELKLIKAAQQQAWAKVNAKTKWSDADFQDALFSHNEYRSDAKDWYYSLATLEKLAFDPRTPEPQARQLHQLLIAFHQQK